MSMTTELIEKLREQASLLDEVDNLAIKAIKSSLIEAAGVIEELSAKLHASQMERSIQYYSDRWISCDEMLPEKDGTYVVTIRCLQDEKNVKLMKFSHNLYGVDALNFFKNERPGWYRLKEDVVFGYCEETNVIAWMPLPEEYRGSDKHDN